jgi:hypothetical protein
MSGEYLASCKPILYFAPPETTGKMALSKDFKVLDAHYVESSLEAEEEELEPEDFEEY